jgi:high-affinity iron transporter
VEALAQKAAVLESLFSDAETALSPDAASDASTFIGALTILLREGLEALLIVVAMIAFLRKADRPEVLPYVHGGWIAALIAGGATWAVATYAISISGASRELTEGFGSLFAAVVLVSVGIWMHGKSHAESWQRYIREALGKALSRRSAWFLFGLAFLVVYREAFETILFFAALAAQGSGSIIAAGAGTAVVLLGVIAWTMLRYSRSLPIGKFFAYSSVLIAVLAVVLAGKGTAALQEAGLIDITPVAHIPRLSMLGIFPSLQPLLLQILALAVLWIGFRYNDRKHASNTAAAE